MSDDVQDGELAKFAKLYEGHSITELIQALARVRKEKDDAEEEAKTAGREHEYLSKMLIPDRFAEAGIKNMTVEGIGRVNLTADIYASIKAGAKEDAYTWISDIGSGDLIQPSIPPSTLKAFLKNRIKAGEDIPEEYFNCTPFQQARITKV